MVHLGEEHSILLLLLRGALANPAEQTLACVDDEAVVRVKTRQDKGRQGKTRQNRLSPVLMMKQSFVSRQDKTRQGKTRQNRLSPVLMMKQSFVSSISFFSGYPPCAERYIYIYIHMYIFQSSKLKYYIYIIYISIE
eukprot:COSAG06_NODE_4715_length_4014_cov_42.572158_1_plen_137_part_00